MSSTQDVRFAEGMIDEGAKLANKLWNAARFVLLQTDPEAEPAPLATTAEDRWILSRLAGTIDDVVGQLDAYDFAAAVKGLYGFIWNDFCDWYVEAAKARLYGDDEAARRQVSATLLWVLERTVALAHPVMPFVTEEIWGFLPGERGDAAGVAGAASRSSTTATRRSRSRPATTWRWCRRRGAWPARASGRW